MDEKIILDKLIKLAEEIVLLKVENKYLKSKLEIVEKESKEHTNKEEHDDLNAKQNNTKPSSKVSSEDLKAMFADDDFWS